MVLDARLAGGQHRYGEKVRECDLRHRGMARAKYATTLQPQLIQPVLDMAFTYGGLPRHVDAAKMIGRT